LCHRRGAIRVIYRNHARRNDLTGVEVIGDDVCGRADDLHAALMGLMVRFCAKNRRRTSMHECIAIQIEHSHGVFAQDFLFILRR